MGTCGMAAEAGSVFKNVNGVCLVLLVFFSGIHHECFSYQYFIFSVKLSNIIVLNYRHIYNLYTQLIHVLVLVELLLIRLCFVILISETLSACMDFTWLYFFLLDVSMSAVITTQCHP